MLEPLIARRRSPASPELLSAVSPEPAPAVWPQAIRRRCGSASLRDRLLHLASLFASCFDARGHKTAPRMGGPHGPPISPACEPPFTRAVGIVDVIDRVLDKGIVIDAWARHSMLGLELVSVQVRIVVASIELHQRYAAAAPLATTPGSPMSGRAGLDSVTSPLT